MLTWSGGLAGFAAFGLASQALLVAYFAARRWRLRTAERYGWAVYALGVAAGTFTGAALIWGGSSWRLFTGPLLFAAWSAFGAWADLLRREQWRSPICWPVLGPYLVLYLGAQMFLWWPLWDAWRTGWAVYLVVFAANTLLNISTHPDPRPKPAQGTTTGA